MLWNNKNRYCSTLKAVLQYSKKESTEHLEGVNKEPKKDAFLVPYFLFERFVSLICFNTIQPVAQHVKEECRVSEEGQ